MNAHGKSFRISHPCSSLTPSSSTSLSSRFFLLASSITRSRKQPMRTWQYAGRWGFSDHVLPGFNESAMAREGSMISCQQVESLKKLFNSGHLRRNLPGSSTPEKLTKIRADLSISSLNGKSPKTRQPSQKDCRHTESQSSAHVWRWNSKHPGNHVAGYWHWFYKSQASKQQ